MAKDGKTEKATPRRKKKAREDGQVMKSKDTTNFFNVVSLVIVMVFFGEYIVNDVKSIFAKGAVLVENGTLENNMLLYMKTLGMNFVWLSLKVFAIVFSFSMISHFLQVGFLFSPKAVKPKWSNINPAQYWKKIFSRKSLIELLKSVILFLLLGYIVYFVFRQDIEKIQTSILMPWEQSFLYLWEIFKDMLFKVLLALMFIGAIDFMYQKWEHEENLKMSKSDVKREMKEDNGSPEMKAGRKRMMMDILKQDIVNQTPEATFIAVNPTHYSVAIRYDRSKDAVPVVLVKGVDHVAFFIREIAKEHDIPIVENPPLARELYAKVEPGEQIPQELYQNVISVLHYLIQTKQIIMK